MRGGVDCKDEETLLRMAAVGLRTTIFSKFGTCEIYEAMSVPPMIQY